MSRPLRWLLALTPGLAPIIPLASLALAGLLLLWGASAIGVRWDPLGLGRQQLEAARARATRAESDAAARAAEVAGERRQAERPCALAILPASPTQADLEAAYMIRGSQIIACDAARRLLLETITTERQLQDRWMPGS